MLRKKSDILMAAYDFEFHENKYKAFLNSSNEESRIHYYNEACLSHGYEILNGLYNISITIYNKQNLHHKEAINFLNFGVARRSGMLFYSFQELFSSIPPDRTKRLSQDEAIHFNGQINLIYLNIRGLLDNLACVYFCEKEGIDLSKFRDSQKHLFNENIIKNSNNKEFWEKILTYKHWAQNELKMLRDPIAHRMPLYIVPAFFNEKDQDIFNERIAKYQEHLSNGNLDEAGKALDASRTIGRFVPFFAHDPSKAFRMYPTITKDLGNMLNIFDIVWMELNK